jgi:uncharacterized tellurite resistance protein B-like protein
MKVTKHSSPLIVTRSRHGFLMFKALKRMLESAEPPRTGSGQERHHLHVAVASLLHEATRVDLSERGEERAVAEQALAELFGLSREECARLLEEGREKAQQLTSYFGPVAVIKRDLPPHGRAALIEQLWRVAYADGGLDPYEDHYVRKIGHLLYVSNTDILLARNRARPRD